MKSTTVNTKTYWEVYNNSTKIKLTECINKTKPFKLNKSIILKRLSNENARLRYYFNYSLDDILNATTLKLTSQNFNKNFSIIPKGYLSKSEIELELENLIKLNKKLVKLNNEIKELENSIISYKIYRYILKTFNLSMVDEIIKGYVFNAGYGIAPIRIQRKNRDLNKDVINWNATIRAKNEIIKSGRLPYKVLEKNKKGVITKDNGGVPYFVYITDDYSYWWFWNKKISTLPNQLVYSFTPIRGNNCIIRKLHIYRENNPLVVHNYKK